MRIVTHSDDQSVDVLDLTWDQITFLSMLLADVACEHRNGRWRQLAGELVELMDAGTEAHLRALLGDGHDSQIEPDHI